MKKTLLTLGAVVAMVFALASCGKTNCACKVEVGDTITADAATVKFEDYDGECKDITLAELGDTWNDEGVVFECEEE